MPEGAGASPGKLLACGGVWRVPGKGPGWLGNQGDGSFWGLLGNWPIHEAFQYFNKRGAGVVTLGRPIAVALRVDAACQGAPPGNGAVASS